MTQDPNQRGELFELCQQVYRATRWETAGLKHWIIDTYPGTPYKNPFIATGHGTVNFKWLAPRR